MSDKSAYQVDSESLKAVVHTIVQKSEKAPQRVLQFVENGIEIIYLAAQANCPVGDGGTAGSLAGSMERYVHEVRPGFSISGKVTMMNRSRGQKPYAWMREKGGTIVPRPENKIQRLVWVNQNGDLIFARQVTQKGSHYMEGALIQTKSEVLEEAQIMLNNFVKARE